MTFSILGKVDAVLFVVQIHQAGLGKDSRLITTTILEKFEGYSAITAIVGLAT
jgi:hypothetical protein|tara:strand:+ start:183 stop:341 length:159 start_codon:yes stop_codon:yes gene_type:complete